LSVIVAAAALALPLAACGKDDGASTRSSCGSGSASGAASGAGGGSASGTSCEPKCDAVGNAKDADSTVKVALDEFTVVLDRQSAPAGTIHFALDNKGKEPHEFVVVKASSASELPLAKDGSLDESKLPKGAKIGEVEPFPGGKTCDGTFELKAGTYQLLCNIVETVKGKTEAHLHEGMIREFTVT
jgi:hypothetical protein